ncbi:MAG TPA: glycosyltransferase family 39 protein [Candidatus Polarisedimenticolaceae bacterium]|nr:glycosyltransferase family 39 protein [Candidatus Polarisedimenticolaceae bacterium]
MGAWVWRSVALCAGVLFTLLAGSAARRETPTIDEFAHLPAGCVYWKQGAFELYDKNPPLGRLWMAVPVVLDPQAAIPEFAGATVGWAPWRYGQRFMDANRPRFFTLFYRARLMIVVLALVCGAVLFAWARGLFGERAAAVTTALFFLSPPVLAHGHLATVDVACMLTIFLACAALRWAWPREGWRPMAVVGAALGVALAVKFTALLVVPAFLLLLALKRPGLRRWTQQVGVLLLASLLVVHAAYAFQGSFQSLGGFRFHSSFCRSLQAVLPAALPVPLPRSYVQGFDAVKLDTEAGEFDTYLHGQWSREGWWYYNLVALGLKTPVPVLALSLAGMFLWRRGVKDARETWLVVLPSAFLFVFLSLLNKVDTGVRYVLPLYPFLHLAVAATLAWRPTRAGASLRWREALSAVPVLLGLGIALRAHPEHLAYFNLFAGGTRNGHAWLVDSNLDWGQDLYRLPREVERLQPQGPIGLLYFGHVDPELYGLSYYPIPARPVEGVLAVSASFVMGQQYLSPRPGGKIVWVRDGHLDWLRAFQPVARAGEMWIYDTRQRR